MLIWNKHTWIFLRRGHCCGWSRDMGQFPLAQMWLSSGHISWPHTPEKIRCVWFYKLDFLFLNPFLSRRRKFAAYHVLKGQQTLFLSVCPWFLLCLINKRSLWKYGKYPHPKLRKQVCFNFLPCKLATGWKKIFWLPEMLLSHLQPPS